MTYRIEGLAPEPFRELFSLDAHALAARDIDRSFAPSSHGTPCRVSLAEADEGDEVLLLSYRHLDADSPYRASGPIFVRRTALGGRCGALTIDDRVPDVLASRLLSLRGYGSDARLLRADVIDGAALDRTLRTWLDDAAIAFLHVHFARQGCYAARVARNA